MVVLEWPGPHAVRHPRATCCHKGRGVSTSLCLIHPCFPCAYWILAASTLNTLSKLMTISGRTMTHSWLFDSHPISLLQSSRSIFGSDSPTLSHSPCTVLWVTFLVMAFTSSFIPPKDYNEHDGHFSGLHAERISNRLNESLTEWAEKVPQHCAQGLRSQ